MTNPIMQKLNRTPKQPTMKDLVQMAKGNPDALFDQMMNSNPQFAKFVNDHKNKSPQQIAKEYGLDLAKINQFMNQ